MNRTFRAAEPRGRTLGTMMKDKEEDLALFLEMRKLEKERNNLLLFHGSDELDPPPGCKPGSSPLFKIVSSTTAPAPARRAGVDDLLNSDSDKNDYDWLLTPPGTPLFPSLERETITSPVGNIGTPKARPTVLKSRMLEQRVSIDATVRLLHYDLGVQDLSHGNSLSTYAELANPSDTSRSSLTSRQATLSSGLNSSHVGGRRPSSSGGRSTASRPVTPTGRPSLPVNSKLSRPSTPTSRAAVSSKPVAPPPRSSTPTRSSSTTYARSSTPSSRPSPQAPALALSKPASRSATPTRRPSLPSSLPASSAPPGHSSFVTKSDTATKCAPPPRGTSPTVRSRPWKPSEMPGFSHDAPSNLRTSMPERPTSASRGRPGAPSSRSSSVETGPIARPRRQSCSPSRGRAPNGSFHSGSSVPAVSRSRVNASDSVSPVLIGSKMVERVVNVRRLVPPKQDDQQSSNNSLTGKSSSSPDSSGFGRTLSKKSLDMAMRHMDIRRSIPNSLRPLMTSIPASSMYSVRSGPKRSRPLSVSDSPLATSSNASSEPSVSNNVPSMDGNEIEDDISSEKGVRFSHAGPFAR